MYTRQDLPPSYSGSLFREQGEEMPPLSEEECAVAAEEHKDGEATASPSDGKHKGTESDGSAPVSARPHGGGMGSFLSRLGLGQLLRLELEDLLILALIFILLTEDGESDLLPLLLILLFTGK